jgi:peptide/nickel transport system permease protein
MTAQLTSPEEIHPIEPEVVVPRKFVGRSPGQIAWARLKADRTAMVCAMVVGFTILIGVLAPVVSWLYGISPDETFTNKLTGDAVPKGYLGGISGEHWLGLEPRLGRDMMMQVVYGIRTSLTIAFLAAIISTTLGVVLGVVAGYLGGWVDNVIGWVIDLLLALPFIVFALAAMPAIQAAFYTPREAPSPFFKMVTLVIVFSVFGWVGTARLVRGQVLSLREKEYIEAARAAGAGTAHVLFRQLLPNIWAPILVTFSLAVPGYITAEGALGFLSIGIVEPTPDLGRMISASSGWLSSDPMYFFVPASVLFVIVLTFNLFGDAVRDALDPKTRR